MHNRRKSHWTFVAGLLAALATPAVAAPAVPAPPPAAGQPTWAEFNALTTLAYRFAECLDKSRWDEMRSLFAPQVDVDTTATGNSSVHKVRTAEEHVWHVKIQETGFDGTLLLLGNPQVSVTGDTAEATFTFYGEHVAAVAAGDNFYTIGGYQSFHFRRTAGRWLIDGFRLTPTWQKGNREIMAIGIRRGLERLTARKDPPPADIVQAMHW